MYVLYDRGIDIVFLSDFSIKVLECSDSVVFPFAHMIHKHIKLSSFHSIFIYGMFIYNRLCFFRFLQCMVMTSALQNGRSTWPAHSSKSVPGYIMCNNRKPLMEWIRREEKRLDWITILLWGGDIIINVYLNLNNTNHSSGSQQIIQHRLFAFSTSSVTHGWSHPDTLYLSPVAQLKQ